MGKDEGGFFLLITQYSNTPLLHSLKDSSDEKFRI